MKMSDLQIQSIVDTLPIGYYTGRRIPCALDEEASCSCYSPSEDTIRISLDQLKTGLPTAKTYADAERLIRSNFYHEVSHAILTPQQMHPNDVRNIAEDERIERVLGGYYYGVNFKESLYAINGNPPPKPQKAIQWWFLLCRYGIGNPALLQEFDKIMRDYACLTRNSSYCDYVSALNRLYEKLLKDLHQNEATYEQIAQQLGAGQMPDMSQMQFSDEDGQPIPIPAPDSNNHEEGERLPSKNDCLRVVADALKNKEVLDARTCDLLSRIFENYRRKNRGGGALQGYSGVLNPRHAERKDYRIFDRSASVRSSNQFGTFHLNLFLDVSGSFYYNETVVNSLLACLERLEQTNHIFTFDVVTMGNADEALLDKNKRRISCSGGNYLSKRIEPLYRQVQKPMTYNYNIVLFDGDAYSNYNRSDTKYRRDGEGFKTFNNKNCTIISDAENQEYIKQYAPDARTIITADYTANLITNVMQALQRALS
jgi:hypothetical protein